MGIGSISLPRITTSITLLEEPGIGERQNEFGFSADIRVFCLATQRFRLLQELNGFIRGSNVWQRPASYAEILRKVGAFVPPELPPAFVVDTFMVPFANDDATGLTEVRIHCETLNYDLDGPYALIQEQYSPGVEFITMPVEGANLFWDTAATEENRIKDDERPGIPVRIGSWQFVWHHIGSLDVDYLASISAWDLPGTVNDSRFYSPRTKRVFEKETLLLESLNLTAETDSIGANKFQLTLMLAERRDTWNKFYRGGQVLPQPMYDAAGEVYKPFTPTPWGNLLAKVPPGTPPPPP